ncbi:MAG TPA: hypothetical protein VFP76_00385 [Gemmatimonadota bacterium]|nr:hypothetical protein [Gemmatimonadota bacterium]
MSLLRVWKDRKSVSPHRPKRARTRWMIVVLVGVILAMWLLGSA